MSKFSEKVLRSLEYVVFWEIFTIFGLLPVDTAAAVGRLSTRIFSNRRRIGEINLRLAYPTMTESERAAILRGCFGSAGRLIASVAKLRRLGPDAAKRLFDIEGLEHLETARKGGKAVFLLSAHFGGNEAFLIAAPLLCGCPVSFVYRPPNNPWIARFFVGLRSRFGTDLIARGSGARQKMADLIPRRATILYLPDVNWQKRGGTFVDFFDVPASTSTSLAEFVIDGGVAVVPLLPIWSEERRKFLIRFQPALDFDVTGQRERDIVSITQTSAAAIENAVREYPSEWLWFHKRWNTRPPGEPDLYAKK